MPHPNKLFSPTLQEAIKTLIHERFDKFASDSKPVPTTNGHADPPSEPAPSKAPEKQAKSEQPDSTAGMKRKSESQEEEDFSDSLSDAPSTPPKKKRKPEVEDDAAFAARLQAEENSRARPTRGGGQRKQAAAKKKSPKKKKKTSAKVGSDDDSEVNGSERKVNRNTGFHVSDLSVPFRATELIWCLQKALNLSAPLSALLDGETQVCHLTMLSSTP